MVYLWINEVIAEPYPRGFIFDRHNIYCGTIFFDSNDDVKRITTGQIEQPLQFVVLSERWTKDRMMIDYRERGTDFTEAPYAYSDSKNHYLVILIEWRGGIAERRGIGSIWQKAVESSLEPGPMWKEIVLG